jgi:hypothetical protein
MASTADNEELIAAIRKVIGRLDRFIDDREAGVEARLPPSEEGTHRHTLQAMTCASLPELLLTRGTLLQLLRELGDEAADLRAD